ncbi:MAG TPA: head-tail adaptor protein [Firmicutes bacterium]|nr:head-tail adaptor protein [Bacillota bacterium]
MHLKDKKISLLKAIKVSDGMGGYKITWKEIDGGANIWAYIRYLSGNEFIQAAALSAKVEMIFEINYRTDITTANRVRYNEKDYNITFVDKYEGYKSDLKLYAYVVN